MLDYVSNSGYRGVDNDERSSRLLKYFSFEISSDEMKSESNKTIKCIDFCLSDKKDCIENYLNYYSFWQKAVDMGIKEVVWVNQNKEKFGLYEEHVCLIENNGIYSIKYFVVISENSGKVVKYSSKKVTFFLKNDINTEPFNPYKKNPLMNNTFPYSQNIALFLIDRYCTVGYSSFAKGLMPFSVAYTGWLSNVFSNYTEGNLSQVAMKLIDNSPHQY